jgi:Helix-turn-helix domain
LTENRSRFIVKVENSSGSIPVFWSPMGSFGEDLRMERLSRGIALEEITAVTKISQHHLVALEQDRFRLLPGGILSKGIVRGYTSALGLDQHDWTERFLKAYIASGQVIDDDRSWMAFAANVGKARILRHDAFENRLRWLGAILLLLAIAAAAFLTVRYFGVRAGWWTTLLPAPGAHAVAHAASSFVHTAYDRVQSWFSH